MSALEDMSPVQLRAANTRLTELNNAGEACILPIDVWRWKTRHVRADRPHSYDDIFKEKSGHV